LFLQPGRAHCGGGEGPNVFDKIGALERWVEKGQAPEQFTTGVRLPRQLIAAQFHNAALACR
jgi:feruloyl esterase